jgi:hypothetical protein
MNQRDIGAKSTKKSLQKNVRLVELKMITRAKHNLSQNDIYKTERPHPPPPAIRKQLKNFQKREKVGPPLLLNGR